MKYISNTKELSLVIEEDLPDVGAYYMCITPKETVSPIIYKMMWILAKGRPAKPSELHIIIGEKTVSNP